MRKKKTRNREAGYFVASVCTDSTLLGKPCALPGHTSVQLFWVIHKLLKYVFSSQNKKHNFFFFSISVWAGVLHLCPVLFSVQEDDSVTPLGHSTVMLQYLSGSRLPVGSSAREQEMELMGERCHLPSADTLQSGALTERQSFRKLS